MTHLKGLAAEDVKTRLEFLRIATMIGQKIDVIWVTFLTTYVSVFGFALFYDGEIKGVYFVFIVVSMTLFTWINFRSLWHHYRFQNEMGRVFFAASEGPRLDDPFASLEPLKAMYTAPRSEYTLIATHLSGLGVYLFFVFEKYLVN